MSKREQREIPLYDSTHTLVHGRMKVQSTQPSTDYDRELVAKYEEEDGHPYLGPRYLARHSGSGRGMLRARRNSLAREIRRAATKELGRKPPWIHCKMEAHKRILTEQLRELQAAQAQEEASVNAARNDTSSG
jgi:hypothetical protein